MARAATLAPPPASPLPATPPAGQAASPPRFAHQSEADGQLLEAFTPDFYLPDYDQYIELTTLRQSLATYKNRKLRLMRERHPQINVKLLNRRDVFALLQKFGIDPRGHGEVPQVDRVLF